MDWKERIPVYSKGLLVRGAISLFVSDRRGGGGICRQKMRFSKVHWRPKTIS